MARVVVKSGHPRNARHNEMGLCPRNINTTLSLTINVMDEPMDGWSTRQPQKKSSNQNLVAKVIARDIISLDAM